MSKQLTSQWRDQAAQELEILTKASVKSFVGEGSRLLLRCRLCGEEGVYSLIHAATCPLPAVSNIINDLRNYPVPRTLRRTK